MMSSNFCLMGETTNRWVIHIWAVCFGTPTVNYQNYWGVADRFSVLVVLHILCVLSQSSKLMHIDLSFSSLSQAFCLTMGNLLFFFFFPPSALKGRELICCQMKQLDYMSVYMNALCGKKNPNCVRAATVVRHK